MATHKYALGVVGSGHIASVIVRRLIESGYLTRDRIVLTESRKLKAHPMDVTTLADSREVVRQSRVVMISVTPQKFSDAAPAMRESASAEQLFVSVMAGVSSGRVAEALGGSHVRVVRAMPNLPFGLGRGVTGLFRGASASDDDVEEVKHFFGAGGVTVEVANEDLMNAVTAVAGSGPAYFYYFVEMMIAGGVAAGLKPEDAQVLAAHACVGAGAMLLQKDASPAELRAAVTSPGGTTQAAMDVLRQSSVAQHVTEAVQAAFNRSRELGRMVENAPKS